MHIICSPSPTLDTLDFFSTFIFNKIYYVVDNARYAITLGHHIIRGYYLNIIKQLQQSFGLKDKLEVCLTCSRLLAVILMLMVFQNLRCSNNEMTLQKATSEQDQYYKLLTISPSIKDNQILELNRTSLMTRSNSS